MGITVPSVASRLRWGAAMVNKGEVFLPETEDDMVEAAVRGMLVAANHLCTAADMAQEGDVVSHYINSAIRLRDLANSLKPDRPDWPANVIPFVPRA